MKTKPIIASTVTVFGLILTTAQTGFAQDLWGDLSELFYETYAEGKVYLDEWVAEQFGEYAPIFNEVLNDSLGASGMSDPLLVREQIQEGVIRLDRTFDLSHPPAVVQSGELIKELERERLRTHAAASTLGREGQAAVREKMARVNETIFATQEFGYQAMEAFSTQEAIKQIAQQNASNAELLGALHQEIANGRTDEQIESQVLANVSQTLDEERKARINRELAAAAAHLSIASQSGLF